jgi:Ca2+-binding EF-hand superfamily protein
MRLFGRNPTDREVDDAIAQSDYTQNGVIDFQDFLIIMTSNITSNDIEDDLKEAFKM